MFIGVIAVVVLIVAVVAIAAEPYIHPHTVNVLPPLTEYLEGTPIENGTAIDWGDQPPGIYYYNYTIHNNTTYPLNVTLTLEDFPYTEGFMFSWTDMETHDDLNMTIIDPETSAIGDLTLVIPLGASGSYAWTHYIYVEEATT